MRRQRPSPADRLWLSASPYWHFSASGPVGWPNHPDLWQPHRSRSPPCGTGGSEVAVGQSLKVEVIVVAPLTDFCWARCPQRFWWTCLCWHPSPWRTARSWACEPASPSVCMDMNHTDGFKSTSRVNKDVSRCRYVLLLWCVMETKWRVCLSQLAALLVLVFSGLYYILKTH